MLVLQLSPGKIWASNHLKECYHAKVHNFPLIYNIRSTICITISIKSQLSKNNKNKKKIKKNRDKNSQSEKIRLADERAPPNRRVEIQEGLQILLITRWPQEHHHNTLLRPSRPSLPKNPSPVSPHLLQTDEQTQKSELGFHSSTNPRSKP